jgi:hypothetical protein
MADARNTLALAIAAVAQSDGDYTTAIPALSLHRRSKLTAPMHCIYGLGLGVVAQGGKQVMRKRPGNSSCGRMVGRVEAVLRTDYCEVMYPIFRSYSLSRSNCSNWLTCS